MRTLIAFFMVMLAAHTANADTWDTCTAGSGQTRIDACTQLIGSGSLGNRDLATAHHSRGNGYWEVGLYQKSVDEYTRSLELDPNSPHVGDTYYSRALSYYETGDWDKSHADFTKAIEINPDDAWAYFNRGNVSHDSGDYEAALDDYRQAVALDPSIALAHRYSCDLLVTRFERYQEAIRYCDDAIRLEGPSADLFFGRGFAHACLGDAEAALADYRASVKHASAQEIANMQQFLAKAGFYDGPLDGADGPALQAAIEGFARAPQACG